MIGVIDIGISNVGSVLNMFKYVGCDAKAVSTPGELETCTKFVLPGVGSFDTGMAGLVRSGMIDTLNHRVQDDLVPVLGICLGMQLMCIASEEGSSPGLGWVDARVRDFRKSDLPPKKTPHMGWNTVSVAKPSVLSADFSSETRFYFVHTYYVDCKSQADVLLTTRYGIDFGSAFQVGNIIGMQFHPEESYFCAELLKKFGSM